VAWGGGAPTTVNDHLSSAFFFHFFVTGVILLCIASQPFTKMSFTLPAAYGWVRRPGFHTTSWWQSGFFLQIRGTYMD
jgi:hypothetical protein